MATACYGLKGAATLPLSKTLLFLILVCCFEAYGQTLEIVREADLHKEPSRNSERFGRLPVGTLVEALANVQGEFQKVRVELEDNEVLVGWIHMSTIRGRKKVLREKEKLVVPYDEAILLKRNPTFLYGAQLGGGMALIAPATAYSAAGNANTTGGSDYLYGLGFSAGAHVGFYASKTVPVRLEVLFSQARGSSDTTPDTFMNYFVVGVVPSLLLHRIELSLGLNYSIGIGYGREVARGSGSSNTTSLIQPTDLSSLGGVAGFGYHFNLSDMVELVPTLRYQINISMDPFFVQTVQLCVVIQVKG